MVGGMVQYSRNSFAFTKLIIHIQQIVFIFKNENILIQQNSYSHSTKIFSCIFNKNPIHIQQKSHLHSTKISFTFNKNLIHIQQKSHSHSTKTLFIFNKNLIHIQQKSYSYPTKIIRIQQNFYIKNMDNYSLS